eukprot:gene22592-29731_t
MGDSESGSGASSFGEEEEQDDDVSLETSDSDEEEEEDVDEDEDEDGEGDDEGGDQYTSGNSSSSKDVSGSDESKDGEEEGNRSRGVGGSGGGGGYKHEARKAKRFCLQSRITSKSTIQEGEELDMVLPKKFPDKPMVEHIAGSNVWYQGVDGSDDEKIEWLNKRSSRIWKGSYKGGDWRYLGRGAWAPRNRARPPSMLPSRTASMERAGGSGEGNRKSMKRQHWSKRGRYSEETEGTHGGGHHRQSSGGVRSLGGDRGGGRSESGRKNRSTHPPHPPRRRQRLLVLQDEDEDVEVMSSRPAQTSGTGAVGTHRHVDEQQSERDRYYGSTHSPNMAESPALPLCGVDSTRNSSRSSFSEGALEVGGVPGVQMPGGAGGGGAGSGHRQGSAGVSLGGADPYNDPLAKWFKEHFKLLLSAGTLNVIPVGLPEAGKLPAGFTVDKEKNEVNGEWRGIESGFTVDQEEKQVNGEWCGIESGFTVDQEEKQVDCPPEMMMQFADEKRLPLPRRLAVCMVPVLAPTLSLAPRQPPVSVIEWFRYRPLAPLIVDDEDGEDRERELMEEEDMLELVEAGFQLKIEGRPEFKGDSRWETLPPRMSYGAPGPGFGLARLSGGAPGLARLSDGAPGPALPSYPSGSHSNVPTQPNEDKSPCEGLGWIGKLSASAASTGAAIVAGGRGAAGTSAPAPAPAADPAKKERASKEAEDPSQQQQQQATPLPPPPPPPKPGKPAKPNRRNFIMEHSSDSDDVPEPPPAEGGAGPMDVDPPIEAIRAATTPPIAPSNKPFRASSSSCPPPLSTDPTPPRPPHPSVGKAVHDKEGKGQDTADPTPPRPPHPSASKAVHDKEGKGQDTTDPTPPRPPHPSASKAVHDKEGKGQETTDPTPPRQPHPSASKAVHDKEGKGQDTTDPTPPRPPHPSVSKAWQDREGKGQDTTDPTPPRPPHPSVSKAGQDREGRGQDTTDPTPPRPPHPSGSKAGQDREGRGAAAAHGSACTGSSSGGGGSGGERRHHGEHRDKERIGGGAMDRPSHSGGLGKHRVLGHRPPPPPPPDGGFPSLASHHNHHSHHSHSGPGSHGGHSHHASYRKQTDHGERKHLDPDHHASYRKHTDHGERKHADTEHKYFDPDHHASYRNGERGKQGDGDPAPSRTFSRSSHSHSHGSNSGAPGSTPVRLFGSGGVGGLGSKHPHHGNGHDPRTGSSSGAHRTPPEPKHLPQVKLTPTDDF